MDSFTQCVITLDELEDEMNGLSWQACGRETTANETSLNMSM